MKIEQLIVQYLYNNKQVALQGIGIFKLRPDIAFPAEGDKDFSVPADAFSFDYNLKTAEDEGLVDFIVQQTGKIKPLASSDLESYAILAKQFLNLGKPLRIEGVGTIQKSQKGNYEFTAGNFINPKIDDIFKPVTERKEDEVSFESESTANNKGRNLMIILSIIGVILVGLALYYFLVLKNNGAAKSAEETTIAPDTLQTEPAKTVTVNADTTHKNIDSVSKPVADSSLKVTAPAAPQTQIKSDSSNFKVVLKEYNTKESVQKAYSRLTHWGHKLEIIKVDSVRYKLAMPFTSPLSDTSKVRDSLQRFFGGKPYVQH